MPPPCVATSKQQQAAPLCARSLSQSSVYLLSCAAILRPSCVSCVSEVVHSWRDDFRGTFDDTQESGTQIGYTRDTVEGFPTTATDPAGVPGRSQPPACLQHRRHRAALHNNTHQQPPEEEKPASRPGVGVYIN